MKEGTFYHYTIQASVSVGQESEYAYKLFLIAGWRRLSYVEGAIKKSLDHCRGHFFLVIK
jgi:hypothetical protein